LLAEYKSGTLLIVLTPWKPWAFLWDEYSDRRDNVMPAKKYRSTSTYTDRDVARLAKMSLNSLRVAKSRGKVNTSNLKSVVEFIIKQRLSNWKL
jgi:hypothetical protein